MDRLDNEELKEWSQNQPLSILRLDPIDRAILKISGTLLGIFFYSTIFSDSLFLSSLAVRKKKKNKIMMKNSQSKL